MARPTYLVPPPPPRGGKPPAPMRRNGGCRPGRWPASGATPGEPAPTNGSGGDELTAPSSGSSTKAPPATETIGRRAGALSRRARLSRVRRLADPRHLGRDGRQLHPPDGQLRRPRRRDLQAARPVPRGERHRQPGARLAGRAVSRATSRCRSSDSASATLLPRGGDDEFGAGPSPDWLADFGLDGPAADRRADRGAAAAGGARRMARDRMQTLATMVMLGMNRIVVKDGSITARLRFRAAAADGRGRLRASATIRAAPAARQLVDARQHGLRRAGHQGLDGRRQRPDRQRAQGRAVRRGEDQFRQRDDPARPLRRRCAADAARARSASGADRLAPGRAAAAAGAAAAAPPPVRRPGRAASAPRPSPLPPAATPLRRPPPVAEPAR